MNKLSVKVTMKSIHKLNNTDISFAVFELVNTAAKAWVGKHHQTAVNGILDGKRDVVTYVFRFAFTIAFASCIFCTTLRSFMHSIGY